MVDSDSSYTSVLYSLHLRYLLGLYLPIKPSRFGSVRTLFETTDYCLENDISMFGGRKFELGVGRKHLYALTSLSYLDEQRYRLGRVQRSRTGR